MNWHPADCFLCIDLKPNNKSLNKDYEIKISWKETETEIEMSTKKGS